MRMLLVAAFMSSIFFCGSSWAQCSAYPYNLVNGTTADANQVMADFNSILNCTNSLAPLANPQFTGTVNITGPGNAIKMNSPQPTESFTATGATTDQKTWDITESSAGTALTFRAVNDNYSAATTWMQVNRGSGYGVTNVVFPSSISALSYITTSDKRLKRDIAPIEYGTATIMKLNPIGFNWIKQQPNVQSQHQIGLIAQEVEAVVPEAVSVATDDMQTRGISYSALVPILIKAIQELKLENNDLETRLKVIEARPASLNSVGPNH